MSLTDNLGTAVGEILEKTLNRYRLSIPTCNSELDVEDFSGREGLSTLYDYSVMFTCTDKNLDAAQFLNQPATFSMGSGALMSLSGQKVVHGRVTYFQRLSGSEDQAKYQVIIEPFLKLLGKQFRTHRFFINKSVIEVVTQVLQEHGLKDWEYEFVLKNDYPKREQINQYQESDLAFIERLLTEVGIFYFFTLQPDTQTEVVHFADDQSAWEFGKKLPLNSPSGMNDNAADSVSNISVRQDVAQASVTAGDYNHREAQQVLLTAPADATNGEGAGTTYGDVYHYRAGHLESGDKSDPAMETGNFRARIEHERFLAEQTLVSGASTDATLSPGQVLTITETALIPTLPSATANGLVIVRTLFTASRQNALSVLWAAVPYSETRCWRPAAIARPVISGTLMARVTSAKANDVYAHLNPNGLYWVKFDADRDDKAQGYESMPVRLAKPYGGDTYGMHFPLIQGTEVAVAFHEGDPDRPYIAHALHDSRHPDHVTADNNTRNVIRTAGLNKLRMEDKRGEEHVKLSTEYGGKTQLNLGHNVDAARALRGEGAELRTDKWVAVRGGAGVFITADSQPVAGGMMLDMAAALSQLQQAQSLAESLSSAAETAKAELADLQTQKALLSEALKELKKSALLFSAPEGIAQVTPKTLQLSAGENITATSGGNTDFSILKKMTVAAGERISFYAQKLGIKLFAGSGKVEIQAQSDEMTLDALKDIRISSSEGKIIISAKKEIILTSGGGYIRIADGSVECAAPDKIIERGAVWQKFGGKSINQAAQEWESADFAATPKVSWPYKDSPVSGQSMKIQGGDGGSKSVTTSASGETESQKSVSVDGMKTSMSDEG
ncbi:type VI secretion system Vgr family protein [Scandinavium goeteborgense]|uniref:type VI secretion system Vgr family protein n=1 Tax=Scandinavium goeteborgense TaxID=1851514 RepID=UPI000F6816C9|nr:type VI secretion system Vgr family protein [Scandinavium goeteborgense]QKN82976.1 type VI secretion system tip protein VgrG [Scandinavium goeteborgense]